MVVLGPWAGGGFPWGAVAVGHLVGGSCCFAPGQPPVFVCVYMGVAAPLLGKPLFLGKARRHTCTTQGCFIGGLGR